jgi:hypothetical protein
MNNLLTTYNINFSHRSETSDCTAANILLKPFLTAFGREVNIENISHDDNSNSIPLIGHKDLFLKFKVVQNTHSLAIRIFAALAAILLFPITIAGIIMKLTSSHQKQLVAAENKILQTKETVLTHFNQLNDTNSTIASLMLKEKVERLTLFARSIHQSLVQELPFDLTQWILLFEKEFAELLLNGNSATASLTTECKDQVTYQDLRALKRSLSMLARYNSKKKLPGSALISPRVQEFHSVIREFYYEKFSSDHIAANLREKQTIPSLKSNINLLYKDENTPEAIETIREAFADSKNNPSQVTWTHGTQSATLAALSSTDLQLKSSGTLRKEKKLAFCGENSMGARGVNELGISGASLQFYQTAIHYATGGIGHHEVIDEACKKMPEKVIEGAYCNIFEEYIQKYPKNLNELYDAYEIDFLLEENFVKTKLDNFHRQIKMIWTLEGALFEKKLLPKIEAFCKLLEKDESQRTKTLLQKVFEPILSFKKDLPVYSEEEKKLISQDYPLIYGAHQIQLLKQNEHGMEGKYARPPLFGSSMGEYVYQGSLTLGVDLSFMFVPQEKVLGTRQFLANKKIQNVKVCNISSLILAPLYTDFRKGKKTVQN